MNFKNRGIRGALVAVVVALSVGAAMPAVGAGADAAGSPNKAILKAIL